MNALRRMLADEPNWDEMQASVARALDRHPCDVRFRLLSCTTLVAVERYSEAIERLTGLIEEGDIASEMRAAALAARAQISYEFSESRGLGEATTNVLADLRNAVDVVPHWPAPVAKLVVNLDHAGECDDAALLARAFVRDYWSFAMREPTAHEYLRLPTIDLTTYVVKSYSGAGVRIWLDLLKRRARN